MRAIPSKIAAASIFSAFTTDLALSQVAKPDSAAGPSFNGLTQSISDWGANHPGATIAIALGAIFLVGWTVYHRMRPNR